MRGCFIPQQLKKKGPVHDHKAATVVLTTHNTSVRPSDFILMLVMNEQPTTVSLTEALANVWLSEDFGESNWTAAIFFFR